MAKPSQKQINKAVKDFIAAPTWEEKKRIVEARRNMLLTNTVTNAVDLYFANQLKKYQGNANMTRLLEEDRDLLTRCRRDGIERSFAANRRPDELQSLLSEIEQLSNSSDMSRRAELCRAALRLVKSDTQPQQWAALQCQLAKSLEQNPQGERADNLEQAILHLQQAMKVYTRQAFPVEWAWTQNDLAFAYIERIQGERIDNLEQAILHAQQALEVLTHQTFPVEWARAQFNLATAHYERIQDERAYNLEQVILHLEQALEVFTRKAFPEQCAMMQNNLALAYIERIGGEHANNVEQAIYHLKQALEVYTNTHQAYLNEWAATQDTLGRAYRERIRGERTDNLEQAIHHYQQALQVRTCQAFPQDWSITQNNLGIAYLERIQGERADNLEQAILHLQQALEEFTQETFPKQWAAAQGNLGNAYFDRIRGERAVNLEQAIYHYQQALQVFTRQASPADWANAENNLGNAYYACIHGERAENLEQAISHYQHALQVFTRQTFPVYWAITQHNLAVAYRERIRGERAENLEQAISHFEQVLEVRTREAFPVQWAMTQNNLAIAYRERIRGERADNLEQAILLYQHALEVRTWEAFPVQWAMTQNNLANAYQERIRGERADNLEQAIHHYQHTLEVYTRQTFPWDWARTEHNLARAYQERICGERADNLEQAIHHYQHALEVRTPMTFPQDCRDTAYWLGRLLYDARRFSEARQALQTAHQAVEALRGEVQRDVAKRSLSKENADLYGRLVSCCLKEGDEAAAFEYATAGKGRAFVDLLATTRFDLSAASANDPALASDLLIAKELRQQIDNFLVTLTGEGGQSTVNSSSIIGIELPNHTPLPPDIFYAQLRSLQLQETHHWNEMAYKYHALTATQKASALSISQACSLAAELNATLVEYYRHAEEWCAFVLTPEGMHYVPLPLITEDLLERMVIWMVRLEHPTGRNRLSYVRLSEWYNAIFAPLEAYLPQNQPVVVAPFSILHLLPLAAVRHPHTGGYVAEDYQIAFVPSLSALRTMRDQTRHTGREKQAVLHRLLTVAYPGAPGSQHYLPHVLDEAEAIAKHFTQVTPLYQEDATPDAVLLQSHEQDAIHFGCHGWFDLDHPEHSGLMLDGGWLTVQRIITELHLEQTHVATLATCLSGRAAPRRGDELVGLLQAFLSTGVQTVVASLWPVDDAATRVLFETFYTELVAGHSSASALQEAARFVRAHPGWEHPYYWAAFQVSGLAHGWQGKEKLPVDQIQNIE